MNSRAVFPGRYSSAAFRKPWPVTPDKVLVENPPARRVSMCNLFGGKNLPLLYAWTFAAEIVWWYLVVYMIHGAHMTGSTKRGKLVLSQLVVDTW